MYLRDQILLLALVLTLPSVGYAQDLPAKTSNGRGVVLHEDGTWTWAAGAEESNAKSNAPAASAPASTFDWRGVRWGDSRKMVERTLDKDKTLKRHREKGSDDLMYIGRVGGEKAAVLLAFTKKDQLAVIVVVLRSDFHNKNQFFSVYDRWRALLAKKYGESEMQPDWTNDLYQDDQSSWGMAVSLGHLSLRNEWTMGDSAIELEMTGSNFDVSLHIRYRGPHAQKWWDERSERQADGM